MDKLMDLYNRYQTEGRMKIKTLEYVKQELNFYQDKIVLYGAGSAGIAFIHYLEDAGIDICCFSDGDIDKHGTFCEGKEIIPPESICERFGSDALVIVTINTDGNSYCKDFKEALKKNGHKGLHARLHNLGCKNVIDYTYFRQCFDLYKGGQYNLPACSDVYLMEKNWDNISQVYRLLEDDSSKDTFLKILEFRMIDDSVDIPTFPEKDMYFEYDLFNKRKDEVFVDCGACTGSSLKDFFRINGDDFEKCISIEPDTKNYKELLKYVSGLEPAKRDKVVTYNVGAYSHDGEYNFFELNGPGTFASESGNNNLKVMRIDSILQGEKATYIKMNIEGAEVPALQGAEYTIRTFHPRLAIMGYHKTSDLWEVPLKIKELNPHYKICLRSYMHNIAFAYYAC